MKHFRTRLICLLLSAMILIVAAPGANAASSEKNGDIVILYTSDIHCGVDKGFGYAGLQQVRDYLINQGNQVLLVDNGDNIQGEAIGTMTKGEALLDLMNQMEYDIAIPGNHEFDYGMDQFLSLVEKARFPYISCNFTYNGNLVFDPYIIRELAGRKIAFVGVTTPTTLKSSLPAAFMDEHGNFVYGFCQDKTGEALYEAVQTAVDAAIAEGADTVVVLGHMGNDQTCSPWTYADVISHTNGIDVFLDGHSHDTDQVIMKNKDGKEVHRSACGTKLACIGWCRISADGTITTGLYTWTNTDNAPDLLGIDNTMRKAVSAASDELSQKLEEIVASSQVDLTITDPIEIDSYGRPYRMIRLAETNMGDFCADAYRIQSGADIGIINGGVIRDNINIGDISLGNILSVHPYGNALCVIEVTGQQLLDALEWGARNVPNECGGFLQVSGISYEIHSYLKSPCIEDESGYFAGVDGERRVKNVLFNSDPVEPEKTYTLAGIDYILLDNGDGFTMFKGAPVLENRTLLDNQVLINYILESLNGTIGQDYEDPYGQGRIVIMEEKP